MENDDMELGLSENVDNVVGVGGDLASQASDGTGNITTLDFDIENGKNSDEGFALDGKGEAKGDFLEFVNKVEAKWAASQEQKPDVDLNLGLGFEPSSSSSSSLTLPPAFAMERDTRDYGQNKRPKIQSFPLYWGSNFENRIIGVGNAPDLRISESDGGNNSDPLKSGDCSEMRMDLTDDLLHMIFSFLDNIDLCSVASVCRQWRDASSHEDFWRYLNFENRPISEHQFRNMCRRYPNANSVNLCGTPAINQLGMKAIRSLRNLEVLTLGNGQLGEKFFKVLTDCRKLRSLTINDATLCSGTQDVSVDHDSLRDLQIVKCRIFRVTIRCPQLEILSLKRSSMPHAFLSCPLLRELDIASCHKLLDTSIRSAAASCPLLESLDMSNCSSIIDETIREIAMSTGNLRFLDASYCPNIALETTIS
ncbi:F-box/LRR-repeat protein 15 [Striga hermonthica]|uniref:F-box/LRR-repeat protein 15 n=1 Tax=Striga hermonthica TaxID=68872 RepID=A0A9N7NSX8_STRHE|nr:F-box/LRR-repeat protein 15 [Striga hermonthica]